MNSIINPPYYARHVTRNGALLPYHDRCGFEVAPRIQSETDQYRQYPMRRIASLKLLTV